MHLGIVETHTAEDISQLKDWYLFRDRTQNITFCCAESRLRIKGACHHFRGLISRHIKIMQKFLAFKNTQTKLPGLEMVIHDGDQAV